MTCEEAFREISNYLDGDMDENLKRELLAHLQICRKCEIVLDTTRKTIDLYCDGKLFPLPALVRDRLHEALRRRLRDQVR